MKILSVIPLINMASKSISLIARFILVLYIAKYINLESLAQYGFVTSAIAIFIAVSGFGMNADEERRLSYIPELSATAFICRRAVNRIAAAIALYISIKITTIAQPSIITELFREDLILILITEAIYFDIESVLILRNRQVLSNFTTTVRSSVWIPIVVALGIYDNYYRTLDFIFFCWITCSLSFALIFFIKGLRSLMYQLNYKDNNIRILKSTRENSLWYYVTNVGFCGMLYSERFIIASVCGMREAGIFVYIWTFVNAMGSLVQTGFLQSAFPNFVRAWQQTSLIYWSNYVWFQARFISYVSLTFSFICALILIVILPHFGQHIASDNIILTLTLLIASVIRLVADTFHNAIFSAEEDRAWLAINALAILICPFAGYMCVLTFGLVGAGLVALLSAIILFAMRYAVYKRISKNEL